MRFKVDENLPVELAEKSRVAAGHEAATVDDQGSLAPATDVCRAEVRVFVTLDLDFADIRTSPPDERPGPIVLRLFRQDEAHVVDVFRRPLNAVGHDPLEGRPWIVEEKRVRIRCTVRPSSFRNASAAE